MGVTTFTKKGGQLSLFEIEYWANEFGNLISELQQLHDSGPDFKKYESREIWREAEMDWVFNLEKRLLYWAFGMRRLAEEAKQISNKMRGEDIPTFAPFEPKWRAVLAHSEEEVKLDHCISWGTGGVRLGETQTVKAWDLYNALIHAKAMSFESIGEEHGFLVSSDHMLKRGERYFISLENLRAITKRLGDLAFDR